MVFLVRPVRMIVANRCFAINIFLLFFIPGALYAEEYINGFYSNSAALGAAELTENSAIEFAIRDNPDLAAMQARYHALEFSPSQASALPDPVIHFGAINFPTDTFSRSQEPMTQIQVGISQTFPFPGKLGLREQVVEYDMQVAGHGVAEGILQLVKNVKTKWWQLYYLDRALDTVSQTRILLRQFITVAKTKYETGKGLQQDLLLSQLELSKLMDHEIQLQALRRNHAIQLNLLMDLPVNSEVNLSAKISKRMPVLIDENSLYQKAILARPRLQQAQINIDSAKSRLDLAERNRYPDFNVAMKYGDRTGGRSDFVSVMVGVKVPLYAGVKQSQAVSQSSLELVKSRHLSRTEHALIMASISTAVTDYQRARKQFLLFGSGIVLQAQQTVASMLVGYQVSEVDFLNLVRSQITLFNYELRYWKALSDARLALARLEAAVGEESIYE